MPKLRFVSLSAVLLIALALPASSLASTTIGQNGTGGTCSAGSAYVVSTLASGKPNPYTVPAGGGVVTKWKTQAGTGGGSLALEILQPDTITSGTFSPLVDSAVESPTASSLNTFNTQIPVSVGQVIGLHVITGSPDCTFFVDAGLGFTGFSDNPAPLPGSGPHNYPSGLGQEAVNVSAVIEPDTDNDGYGDETQDGCPGNATRQDDCVKPTVKIDKEPKSRTTKTKAKFKFSSDDATATFTCRTDKKDFKPCSSPFKLQNLKKGKHVFVVQAVDANDNVSQAASYKWKVKKG